MQVPRSGKPDSCGGLLPRADPCGEPYGGVGAVHCWEDVHPATEVGLPSCRPHDDREPDDPGHRGGLVGGGGGAMGHEGGEGDRAWTGSWTRWDLDLGGCGSSREGRPARGGGEEWLGFQRGVVDAELGFPWGAGWIGSVLFRPFRCVGSTQMYGADGPVQDGPWEGRY
jgi:hypothetical protein